MATRYWVGGSGTWDSSSTTKWSATSGGAAGASAPTSVDDVIFNSASSGATYVVTVTDGVCHALTTTAPAAGTLTFNATAGYFPTVYGNISVHAACLWTVNGTTTQTAYLSHSYADATAATVTFGNAGANTKCIRFNPSAGSIPLSTAYNFCNSSTLTFAEVNGNTGTATFTCTSSAISIIDPSAVDYITERFEIISNSSSPATITLTNTTITMGQAGVLTVYGKIEFSYFGTLNTTGFNVTCARTYYNISIANYNSSVAAVMANATIKTTGPSSQIHGFRTLGAVNQAGGGILYVSANTSSAFSATSLTTVDAGSQILVGYSGSYGHSGWTSATISSTVAVGAGGVINIIGAQSGFTGLTATFSGAVTVGAGGNFAVYPTTSCVFSSTVTTSGTLASPASFTVYGTLIGSNTVPLTTCAGNSSFTWTTVDLYYTKWEQLTTSTFTATCPAPGSTSPPSFYVGALKTNGGAVSVTNQRFNVGLFNAYFTVSTIDYSLYITTGGLTMDSSGVPLNGGSPTTVCAVGAYEVYIAGALSCNNVYVVLNNKFTSATSTSLTSTYFASSYYYVTAFGALTTTGTVAAYTTISAGTTGSDFTATTASLTNTTIYCPSSIFTFNGAVTYTTTDLTTAQFYVNLYALVNGAFASTFTSLYFFTCAGSGPSGKSISSGGAVTISNSSVTSTPSGSPYVSIASGTTCTAFSVNNLSLTQNGNHSTSTSTTFTAGITNSTFTFQSCSTLAFGALSVSAGSSGTILTLGTTSCTATATTVTTTNASVLNSSVDLVATGAVSFTGTTAGTSYISLNSLIGSSTIAFTNFYTILISGGGFSPPTFTLKGTTLTVNNSGLTDPNSTGSSIVLANSGYAPPITFTGLATFNNVAVTIGSPSYIIGVVTFVGLTLVKGTYNSTGVAFYQSIFGSVTHSIGAVTATSGGYITVDNVTTQINSGAITATNVAFSVYNWVANGTASFASSPTSSTTIATFNSFTNGAFSTTFTSYDVTINSNSSGNAFYSTGNLVLDDTGRASSGQFFATAGAVTFVTGAGVTTWTKKRINIAQLTATGAGGLTLTSASSSDDSWANVSGATSITGPFTVTNQKAGIGYAFNCSGALTVGGNFLVNNSASAAAGTYVTVGSAAITGTTTFTKIGLVCTGAFASTGVASFTGEGSANSNPDNTFSVGGTLSTAGTSNLTIADYYNISLAAVTAGGSLSLTHASQIPYATATGNVTQSGASGAFTLTRVRLAGNLTNTATATAQLVVNNSGAIYSFLSLSCNSINANAGTTGYGCINAGDITISGSTGTASFFNTHLWAGGAGTGSVTHAGGVGKSFSFSVGVDAIPCDNGALNQTGSAAYPGVSFQSFTVTNAGGTFQMVSASTYKRPLISFNQSSATSATMSIPSGITPTFTNVDFWRITPGGTSTKPWTGTNLGRVGGTIANLTTATPKSVYYVGGAGSWQDAKWALSSGGTGSTANYPLPQDNINFDANSGGGIVTVPSSIKIGALFLAGTSPGSTKISPTTNTTGIVNEIWLTQGISGPPSDPGAGNYFILGDTTYTDKNALVLVDGGSSDTITITNAQNMSLVPYASIQYANAGTLNISNVKPVYFSYSSPFSFGPYGDASNLANIDFNTRVVNFTDSTFELETNSGLITLRQGTFNLFACVVKAFGITLGQTGVANNTAIPATPYTWNPAQSFTINGPGIQGVMGSGVAASHLGNLTYSINGNSGSFTCPTANDPVFLKISITDSTSATVFFTINSLGSTRNLYTLSTFNVTNVSGGTFYFSNYTGDNITLNGIAGARNQWTNIVIGNSSNGSRVNVLPATPATWYYSGGSLGAGQTGWNAGTAPVANTGFFFF